VWIEPSQFTGKERDAETGLDYFGARYLSGAQGRFTVPDRPFADQTPISPQSWNLYSYARNNPLKYIDPTGQAIQLMGTTEEERKKELEAVQASLINSSMAGNLYINPELDKNGKETGRFFVGIRGDAEEFAAAGDLESAMAEVVGSKNIVQFGLDSEVTLKGNFLENLFGSNTKDVGAAFGGAVTIKPTSTITGLIQTVIDPNDLRSGRTNVPTPTLGEAVAHDLLGHALGLVRDPEIGLRHTNQMSNDAENAARARGGASRGQRSGHSGGFPEPQMRWKKVN
jgi:RHS repeat-associated protein